MGDPAFGAEQTLDTKAQHDRVEFYRTLIMPIADEASLLCAGTLNPMDLKRIYGRIINILRKVIAVFKDNCYHIHVCCTRN